MLAHFSPEDGLLFRVEETGKILRRYYAIKKALMKTQCGWFSRLPTFRLKYDCARHLYLDAKGAQHVAQRITELMYGRGPFEEPTALNDFLRMMPRCLDLPEYLATIYLTVKQALVDAYHEHLKRTDPVFDAPTIDVLEWLLRYDEEQIAWAKRELHQMFLRKEDKQRIAGWQGYLAALLADAGGILGEGVHPSTPNAQPATCDPSYAERPPYELPWEMRLDDCPRTSIDSEPGEIPADYHMVYAYYQEIDIADLLCLIVYESPDDLPIQYFVDLTRQAWDEVRHTTMGIRRLQELGFRLDQCGAPVHRWKAWRKMSNIERLGWLTQVGEACSLAGKRDHIRKYLENSDTISAAQIEYDIADESGHVRFGSKWIPELLKRAADPRTKRQVAVDGNRSFRTHMADILTAHGKPIPDGYLNEFQGCEDVADPAASF
ncbi:MAG: DUF455 family protein [Abditibacteriales bacterium]|nr:DUF455 family protein [Abditibacteriales bacterium]MDW8364244.1 DUF455 family protein [Abditibacteriales bacterium]